MSTHPRTIRNSFFLLALVASIGACTTNIETDMEYTMESTFRSSSTCGNGVIDTLELCDDGNLDDDDGCDANCLPSGIATLESGAGTTCVVTLAGNAKCWGRNDLGQLGRGDQVWVGDDESPGSVAFIDLGGLANQIQSNGEQTFALLDTGVVRAWGANDWFQLGLQHIESIGDDETPASATVAVDLDFGGPVVQLALGSDFGCALLEQGTIQCWGANDYGQLGYGNTKPVGDDESPAQAGNVDVGGTALGVTAGSHHACALLTNGDIRCWGRGQLGQLGQGNTDTIGDDEVPADRGPVAVGGPVAEIVAGQDHTCARLQSGALRCWGEGRFGQLGYGSTETVGDDELPESMPEVLEGLSVEGLAAGARHTCALLSGGNLLCWGEGQHGQLGYGSTENIGDDELPTTFSPIDLGNRAVSAVFIGPTASSTCVTLDDEALLCWGLNDEGQLGYGHTDPVGNTPPTEPGRIPDIIVVDDSDN